MKVVLKKPVRNLGKEWDVVTVKHGYGRNYLIPQDLADVATPSLIKMAEKHVATRLKKTEELMANAKETVDKLSKVKLTFKMKAKGKKLYGSVTEKDIVDSIIKDHKIELTKDMVRMDEHLKNLGEHKVKIHLTEGVETKISVTIEAE